MQLGVLGLNHNTATVNVRERFAVKKEDLENLYGRLLSDQRILEACIVSTCNRV
ncbi:MAG: glutamyl-tRNA reductase, partial [Deferribacterales bacterium]|nr:glutamyl-tRNA reductase [Deferribacterales bacterium]